MAEHIHIGASATLLQLTGGSISLIHGEEILDVGKRTQECRDRGLGRARR